MNDAGKCQTFETRRRLSLRRLFRQTLYLQQFLTMLLRKQELNQKQTYIAVEDLVSLREGVRRVLAKPTAQSQSCIFEEARDKGEDRSVLDTLTRIDCKVRGEVPVLISVYSSSMKKAQLSNMLPPLSNKIPSLSITDSLSPLPSQSCLHVKLNQVTLATMADVNENISPLSLFVRFHHYIMQNVD